MSDAVNYGVLVGAAVSGGLAMGIGTWLVGRAFLQRGVLEDAQARKRAIGGREFDGLVAVAMPFVPLFGAIGAGFGLDSDRGELALKYARAGYPGRLRDDQLYGFGLVMGLPLGFAVGFILFMLHPMLGPLGLLGTLLGPVLLGVRLEGMGKRRELNIHRTMPFVLDLMVLTMRAGASLQQSVEQVREDFSGDPIGKEFTAVLSDLGSGLTNAEAFGNFASRVPVESVRAFVDDLIQGEELGRPLADIFEGQADRSRQRRVQEANETAGKAKVMVLIPGMLVFIAVLILLFAPFGVSYLYGGSMFG